MRGTFRDMRLIWRSSVLAAVLFAGLGCGSSAAHLKGTQDRLSRAVKGYLGPLHATLGDGRARVGRYAQKCVDQPNRGSASKRLLTCSSSVAGFRHLEGVEQVSLHFASDLPREPLQTVVLTGDPSNPERLRSHAERVFGPADQEGCLSESAREIGGITYCKREGDITVFYNPERAFLFISNGTP